MIARIESPALAEWRAHWPMVAAAMAGLSFATVAVYSMGLFMEPRGREFGWSRAQMSVVLCGAALSQTITPLIAQWLIDGYGWRQAFFWMGLGWGGFVLAALLSGIPMGVFSVWLVGGLGPYPTWDAPGAPAQDDRIAPVSAVPSAVPVRVRR